LPVDGDKIAELLGQEWTVVAEDADGNLVEAVVDKNGYFKFEELPVGEWNFMLDLPDQWEGIVPAADLGEIAETGLTQFDKKDGCYRIVFKIKRLFLLPVTKWEELLDGTVQPGEDWEITVTPVDDPYVKAQTKKTEGGLTQFWVTHGKWTVSEKVKPCWKPLTPPSVTITLDQYDPVGIGPTDMLPVVFKNLEPPCKSEILVRKLGYGTDAKGGEVSLGPLAGWKVTVSRADGAYPPITKVTDGKGEALFEGLLPGVYKVSEAVQVGWEVRGDNPQTVIHKDCETTEVVFENDEVNGELKITGHKLFKAWEKPYAGQLVGLSGWVITATLVGATDYVTTTVTNALGEYEFTEAALVDAGMGFPGATIEVCEEDRDNWIHVTPECVRVRFPYPVPLNYAGAVVDFTNVQDPPLTTAAATAAAGCRASHLVKPGETLARIAATYGTSVRAVAKANGIKNIDYVRMGQTLCIH
jgi:LysM repeat protein